MRRRGLPAGRAIRGKLAGRLVRNARDLSRGRKRCHTWGERYHGNREAPTRGTGRIQRRSREQASAPHDALSRRGDSFACNRRRRAGANRVRARAKARETGGQSYRARAKSSGATEGEHPADSAPTTRTPSHYRSTKDRPHAWVEVNLRRNFLYFTRSIVRFDRTISLHFLQTSSPRRDRDWVSTFLASKRWLRGTARRRSRQQAIGEQELVCGGTRIIDWGHKNYFIGVRE